MKNFKLLIPILLAVLLVPSAFASVASVQTTEGSLGRRPEPRPEFAIELSGSPNGLGGSPFGPGLQSHSPIGVSLNVEFQPGFIQQLGLGVIGIGPVLGVDPVSAAANVAAGPWAIWEYGFEARYQARYFRRQPIVPTLGYVSEYVNYHLLQGATGQVHAQGPVLGAWLLLNTLGPSEASEFYSSIGVSRTYLIAEARALSGGDGNVNLAGTSAFFGLRFEF